MKFFIRIAALVTLGFWFGSSAAAQNFSTTSVDYRIGQGFDDYLYGYNTEDGLMQTVNLEHFGTWKYGQNFFFTSFYFGDFVRTTAEGQQEVYSSSFYYAEWASSLSLSAVSGKPMAFGPVKDILLSGSLNVGQQAGSDAGFFGWLAGGGILWDVPGFVVLETQGYYREDSFNKGVFQLTTVWQKPFAFGKDKKIRFSFQGYCDYMPQVGHDVIAQPRLYWQAAPLLAPEAGFGLDIGIDYYLHYNKETYLGESLFVQAPQLAVKFSW